MARVRRERKLEKGIRPHGSGLQAFVKVNGKTIVQQFDLDTPRDEIRKWLKQQAKLRRRVRRGTLAADVSAYLATIADPRRRVNDAGRLQHWLRTPLANKPRALITSAEIKAAIVSFINEPQPRKARKPGTTAEKKPLSIETANKCLTVLRALYRELNEHDDDPNPAAKVKKLAVDEAPPKAIPGGYAVIEAVLAEMPDRGQAHRGKGNRSTINKAKLRNALIAYTGWPQKQIMRIDPAEDILWGPPVLVRLRPRKKGKGVAERWMQVSAEGEAALRAFVAGAAQGPFSTSSVRRAWQRACRALREKQIAENLQREARGEPPLPVVTITTPYDLRHTFITAALEQSSNIAGTQYLAMHSDPRQTLRYAKAAIPEEARKVIESMRRRGNSLATSDPD